jgi:hypothetical protein
MTQLINEAKRMQQLAGIKYTNHPSGEEILLEFFIEEYCLKNKILQENLHEGIIQKIKDKLQKLNLNPTEGYIVFLLKKLEAILTKDGYTKALNIAKNYNGPNNIKQVTNYINKELNTSLDEAILDIFKNKEGNPNIITRFVTIALATVILYMGSAGKTFPTKTTIDKFPAQNEKSLTPDELQKLSSDSGFDVPIKTQQNLQNIADETDKNVKTDSNKITTDNNKIKITYGTGDSKIQNNSEISKQIGDKIVKKLNGNIFDPTSKIPIKGLISNLPGEDDDNPNGPSKTGLAKDRLNTGLKLIDSIVKYLTDTYPKQFPDKDALKKSFTDGGTNIGDTGPEVKKNSPEAKSNQATEFDTGEIKSKKIPTTSTSPSSPDVLTYFRSPDSLLPDSNKYYVILGYILPLITDNKQPSKEVISLISPKENEVINDSFIDKKILELDKLDTKESKQAENILVWAKRVKKNPKSIGEYFKSLDSKINILWQKRILTKPGEKGKAAFVGGSETTQTPIPGAAAGSILPGAGAQTNLAETSLMKLYSNLLLEAATSEWKSLPDYNDNVAKSNLGTLVPLYVYIWDLNDNGAIEYVASKNSPYIKSWTTFEQKYPIIYRKISNNLIPISNKNKSELTPDVTRVFTTIDKTPSLIAALKRINRRDELQQLIVSITRFVNANINSKPSDIRTDLFSISSKFKVQKSVTEADEAQPDVEKAIQIIDRYTGLKSLLSNINSRKEYVEFMKKFLSYIDPTLFTKRESDIKGALIGAANTITNAGTVYQRQKTK